MNFKCFGAIAAFSVFALNAAFMNHIVGCSDEATKTTIKAVAILDQNNRVRGTIHTAYMLSDALAAEGALHPNLSTQERLNLAGADNFLPPDVYTRNKAEDLIPLSQFAYPINIHERDDVTTFDTLAPPAVCSAIRGTVAVCSGPTIDGHATLKITLPRHHKGDPL